MPLPSLPFPPLPDIDIAPLLTSSVYVWFPVATTAAFIFPLSVLCPWLWWSVLLQLFVWRCAGTPLGSCEEVLSAQKTPCQAMERLLRLDVKTGVNLMCVSGVPAWKPVRHGGLMLMLTLVPDSECMFSYVRTRGPLKKTDIRCHTRTARQQVGGNLCLFVRLCYHLLFPVKTGKERGENGGLESAALMCVGWRSSSVWQWPSRPGKTDLFWA